MASDGAGAGIVVGMPGDEGPTPGLAEEVERALARVLGRAGQPRGSDSPATEGSARLRFAVSGWPGTGSWLPESARQQQNGYAIPVTVGRRPGGRAGVMGA